MAREGKSILVMIFKNFVESLRPRQFKGNLMGSDYLGNKYYEIPADPRRGKRKPSRWFEPTEKDKFDQETPAEWEAWLRGRREAPPEEKEVLENLRIIQLKKKNAAELERKYRTEREGIVQPERKGFESFPKYPDYEISPGKPKSE